MASSHGNRTASGLQATFPSSSVISIYGIKLADDLFSYIQVYVPEKYLVLPGLGYSREFLRLQNI